MLRPFGETDNSLVVCNKAEYSAVANILILAEGSLTILEKCASVCQGPIRPAFCLMPFLQGYQLLPTEEPCLTYDGPLGSAGVVWSHTGKKIQLIHGLTAKKPRVKKLRCTVDGETGGRDMGSFLGTSADIDGDLSMTDISLCTAITPAYGLAAKVSSKSSDAMSEETPAFDLSLEVGKRVLFRASKLTDILSRSSFFPHCYMGFLSRKGSPSPLPLQRDLRRYRILGTYWRFCFYKHWSENIRTAAGYRMALFGKTETQRRPKRLTMPVYQQ